MTDKIFNEVLLELRSFLPSETVDSDNSSLLRSQTTDMMNQIMQGNVPEATLGSILTLLSQKGETAQEVLGFAHSMLEFATPLEIKARKLDIVGTGGDKAMSVNISTMASVVIAATGIQVVKHGNRAATSKSGSADVLASLGLPLDLDAKQVKDVISKTGIGFAFAQVFHPSMRFVAPVRKQLPFPTVFNILGPLTNPSRPEAVAIGAASVRQAELLAHCYASNGTEGLVFQGSDEFGNGLDELAATQHGQLFEVREGKVSQTSFNPMDLSESVGIEPISIGDLAGGTPDQNAQSFKDVLDCIGANSTDTKRERAIFQTVVLNAAAGIVADHKMLEAEFGRIIPEEASETIIKRFIKAYEIARDAIVSGKAKSKLNHWLEVANHVH